MNETYLIVIAVVAAVIFFLATKGKAGDIDIPEAPQRKDLLFGYYGCTGDQVAETKDHVNLHWECFWGGLDKAIADIRAANMTTVLDLGGPTLSDYGTMPRTIRPDAEAQLRSLFDRLQSEGVLHLAKYLLPSDEPNLPENGSVHLLPEIMALIRRVALSYPTLDFAQYGCIYYSDLPMDHIELFDVVGFDQYEEKSGIFAPGAMYERMKKRLRPDQKTWLVPGATFGQDPQPFLNFANNNDEVLGIIPFLWGNPHGDPKFDGIHSMPEMRAQYEAVGRKVIGRD